MLIETIARARQTAAESIAKSFENIEGASEAEVRDRILANLAARGSFYPKGWYDPPPGGVAVLFAEKPYARLQFDSLRKPEFFPRADVQFNHKKTVGIVYASPIDRATGMMGDFSCTVYGGSNRRLQEHIRSTYKVVHAVAERAEVGMSFSELYAAALKIFEHQSRAIRWMTTSHDPLKINLGHTIPGSFEKNFSRGDSFETAKAAIHSGRIYVNAVEEFQIPETCALTVEARLVDVSEPELPNVCVHYIVAFVNGERRILANFNPVFKVMGMDYLGSIRE
ncbi:MAG: hypothetical protein HYW65_02260 [Candidatus Liptonbacteria bacterium]|nr:hypothetical protein [Candidatus Liptonbacteria bacterium]